MGVQPPIERKGVGTPTVTNSTSRQEEVSKMKVKAGMTGKEMRPGMMKTKKVVVVKGKAPKKTKKTKMVFGKKK